MRDQCGYDLAEAKKITDAVLNREPRVLQISAENSGFFCRELDEIGVEYAIGS